MHVLHLKQFMSVINNTFYTGGSFNGLEMTNDVKIAVASSVITFTVGSILFFIIGLLCGCFCQKEKKDAKGQPQGSSNYDEKQELELKENAAYVPVVRI